MRRFGVLGIYSEDIIERIHQLNKIFNRIFYAIRDFEKREKLKDAFERRGRMPGVDEIINDFTASRKRSLSQVTIDRKEKVKTDKNQIKREKVGKLLQGVQQIVLMMDKCQLKN